MARHRRPAAPVLAAAAALLLAGCSGGGGASAGPTTPPPSTASAKPKPKPTATRTPTPTPTATTPPPVTGAVIGTSGAVLARTDPGPARKLGSTPDCAVAFPDLEGARCGGLDLDGGGLVWGAGSDEGAGVVRLLVLDKGAGGWVVRYEGRDRDGTWGPPETAATVTALPLTGHGTDSVVVRVRTSSGALSYDLLTWVAGGPLVLRAHRGPLDDGRLGANKAGLDEYISSGDGTYVRRLVAWDGRHFRIGAGTRVPGTKVPPAS
jgi:hypothetical protein